VSVYANVGSDFPELHKAVVELKGALEEFESAYAPCRTKSGKSSKESTPAQQNGGSGSRTSTPVKEARGTPVPAARSHVVTASQTQEDSSAIDQRYQEDDNDVHQHMPPPRIPQASQHDNLSKEDERHPDPPKPTQSDRSTIRAQSVPQHTPSNTPTPSRPTAPASPATAPTPTSPLHPCSPRPPAQSSCASGRSIQRRCPRPAGVGLLLRLATMHRVVRKRSSTRTTTVMLMSRVDLSRAGRALGVDLDRPRCLGRRGWGVRL
jgi:hypothetical protein